MLADYSIKSIKGDRVGSIFLGSISFVATTFLTFLCSMAYNAWTDHVYRITMLEGSYTPRPEPLALAYCFVIVAACASLILLMHSAFEIPMNSKIRQLGTLKSVGATSRQITRLLLQEAAILCVVPTILGIAAGIGLSYVLMQVVIEFTGGIRTYDVYFRFDSVVVFISLLASVSTVLVSALIPAKKVSKITPLAALGYGAEDNISKMRKFPVVSLLLGVYGELARKSLYARRKELRTSTLSLACAFLALTSLLNIETISGISTQYTYFERFRDKWDIVLTTAADSEDLLEQLKSLEGVQNCIAYKKVSSDAFVSEQLFSSALQKTGIQDLCNDFAPDAEGRYHFSVPIYVLDDASFADYCADNQIEQHGIVMLNKIWNSLGSTKKHREYLPIVNPAIPLTLEIAGRQLVIDAFTQEMPNIKEEYQQYSLTLILSDSYYSNISTVLPAGETTYNMFVTSDKYDASVQEQICNIMEGRAGYTLESRTEEEISEFRVRNALRIFVYCFAGFLAMLGIVNIFSFTLGQLHQRKKEFARYYSVGFSPNGMRKMLSIEALIICIRPLLLCIAVNIPLVAFALKAADISMQEYVAKAPVLPITIFTVAVFLFVVLAYYWGGMKIYQEDVLLSRTKL